MEKYVGVKFKVVAENEKFDPDLLLKLDRLISKYLKVKGTQGNLSIRFGDGFLIKKTATCMTKLRKEDVAFVRRIEDGKVYASGGTPSSESIMHWEVYAARPEVKIVLHFHDDNLLSRNIGVEVGPFSYGTVEQAKAVTEASKTRDLVKILGHGFVLVASDEKDLEKKLRDLKK